jgi:cephalosporin-C deacetylase
VPAPRATRVTVRTAILPGMAAFDLPLDDLRAYRPERSEPPDFDAFWSATLADSRGLANPPRFDPFASALRTVDVADVTFSGFAGQPIKGWLLTPASDAGPFTTVVEYIGYGGGRQFPHGWLTWASAGYAHLVMDTRGQGSVWSPGDTPDIEDTPSTGQHPGFVTRGIDHRDTYYYRRLITDAVLAVDAAVAHPLVDPDRIAVAGNSQGGGLALAVAGLSSVPKAAMIDVPFLCHWRRAVEVTDEHPYRELQTYLSIRRERADSAFATLAYFDGVNFAPRATAPALFSVGLMDDICPPSTVFAAFNHYAGQADIRVWPFNGHDAGQLHQQMERFAFLEGLGLAP